MGVIGDIHSEADVVDWALRVLKEQRVERIFATGDIADGPRHAEGVMRACKLLQAAEVVTVQGNHDRWLLDSEHRDLPDATSIDEIDAPTRAYLQALPASVEVETPLGLLLFGHGLGDNDMASLYPHDHGPALSSNDELQKFLADGRYQLAVNGHTHRRMVRRLTDVTFINAGAVKVTREPCCLVLDFNERRARFFDYAPGGLTKPGPEFEL